MKLYFDNFIDDIVTTFTIGVVDDILFKVIVFIRIVNMDHKNHDPQYPQNLRTPSLSLNY
jgi:hypothetical protein